MKRLAILLLVLPLAANANLIDISWGLFPDSQNVIVGQSFEIDLVVSGLGDGTAPSLEGFDVDITFSDTFSIDPDAVAFGTSLGDPDDSAETQTTSTIIGPGVLFIRLDSLLSASTLQALQGSSFTLATMTFTASDVGTYLFSGDDFSGGLFLTDDSTKNPGVGIAYVNVVAVSEPGTLALFAIGIAGMSLVRRRRTQ